MFKNYFTNLEPSPGLKQQNVQSLIQERMEEGILLGFGKFSRNWLLPAAFIMQMCLGTKYAWSVYGDAAHVHFANTSPQFFSATLGITIFFCGMGNFVGGPLIARRGPKSASLFGCTLFLIGHLISSLAMYLKNVWLLYLGYGAVAGFGVGITFLCPILTLQKYFPDRRGFAAGFAVGGYGCGISIASITQERLINILGITHAFWILGTIYFLFQIPCVLMLRFPTRNIQYLPKNAKKINDKHHYVGREHAVYDSIGRIFKSPLYWLIYFFVILHKAAGVFLFASAKGKFQSIGLNGAEFWVAALGLFNFGGRLILGILCDVAPSSLLFFFTMLGQTIGFAGLMFFTNKYAVFFCTASVIFFYGSGFGMLAVLMIEAFGAKWLDRIFGITMTAFALVGMTSAILRIVTQNQNDRIRNIIIVSLMHVGLLMIFIIRIFLARRKKTFEKPMLSVESAQIETAPAG